jgi:hypothetical protein
MKRILSTTLITGICMLTSGSLVHASAKRFIPRYVDYTGELVIQGAFTARETDSGKRSNSSRELTLQEFFHVKGTGFIYRPTFISMSTDISLGLQQELLDFPICRQCRSAAAFSIHPARSLLSTRPAP